MASIASALVGRKSETDDEQQLLKLFWNRAEVKKELDGLRRETEKLSEQLRQRETAHLRVVQQLESLESILADPLQAANALVFYQLRGVWHVGRKRLARLGRELAERQRVREERHAETVFRAAKEEALAALDEKLAPLQTRARQIESDLHAVDARLAVLGGFWNLFRRKRISHQGEAIRAALEGLTAQIERHLGHRREVDNGTAPAFEGVSVEGKRNINIAIIAMAQQLVLHFTVNNVASLAREASVRPLTDTAYGSASECQELSRLVEASVAALPDAAKLMVASRRRAEYLRAAATFRRDADTVPSASSFAVIPVSITDSGDPRPAVDRALAVNVLADEYWDIYSVLLS